MRCVVRDSRDDDVPRIAAIYAFHVLNGAASFEEEPPPVEELAWGWVGWLLGAVLAAGALTFVIVTRGRRPGGADPGMLAKPTRGHTHRLDRVPNSCLRQDTAGRAGR